MHIVIISAGNEEFITFLIERETSNLGLQLPEHWGLWRGLWEAGHCPQESHLHDRKHREESWVLYESHAHTQAGKGTGLRKGLQGVHPQKRKSARSKPRAKSLFCIADAGDGVKK